MPPVSAPTILATAAIIGLGVGAVISRTEHAATVAQPTFTLCPTGGGTNCVVDGDTLWLDGTKIRVADIDAPETRQFKCLAEKALGDRSTLRLAELVNAGPFTLEVSGRDVDRYGRKLRVLVRAGRSLGDVLVAEGLARRWDGARRGWC